MKTFLSIASCTLMLAVAAPASAKPDKPINAADAASDTGCYVGVDGNYTIDPSCQVHFVEKLNKDGTLAFFRYQDKGVLPPEMPAPATAQQNSADGYYRLDIGGTVIQFFCTGTEFIEPSGQYASNLTCKP